MNYTTFKRRIETIKMFKDKIDNTNKHLTLAFSDDTKYNKIYADGFNFLENRLIDDLVEDMYDSINIETKSEWIKESIEYYIYEIDFGTKEVQFEVNGIKYDCTLYNTWLDIVGLLEENVCDTFKDKK